MPALVDYERAWLRLKVVIAEKPSHGKRDLFESMGEIEVECLMDGELSRPQEQEAPRSIRAAG